MSQWIVLFLFFSLLLASVYKHRCVIYLNDLYAIFIFNVDVSKSTETSDFDNVNEKLIASEFKIYPEE